MQLDRVAHQPRDLRSAHLRCAGELAHPDFLIAGRAHGADAHARLAHRPARRQPDGRGEERARDRDLVDVELELRDVVRMREEFRRRSRDRCRKTTDDRSLGRLDALRELVDVDAAVHLEHILAGAYIKSVSLQLIKKKVI